MITAKLLLAYLLQASTSLGLSVDTTNIDPEEAYCLAKNVYYESKGEDIQGQFAVASVTLNRVNDPRFPDTVCEVVKQSAVLKGSGRKVCAFSWYCEGNKRKDLQLRNRDGTINQAAVEQFQVASIVAIKVLSGRVNDNTNGATHFYNPALAQPAWANQLKKTVRFGNHDFHRLPRIAN